MNHNEAIDRILELHQKSDGYDLHIRDGITAKSCTSCKTTMWPCDTATAARALKHLADTEASPVVRPESDGPEAGHTFEDPRHAVIVKALRQPMGVEREWTVTHVEGLGTLHGIGPHPFWLDTIEGTADFIVKALRAWEVDGSKR